VRRGEIGPFESVKLEVVFNPIIPGETKLEFYIKFSDVNTKPVRYVINAVHAIGKRPDWGYSLMSVTVN